MLKAQLVSKAHLAHKASQGLLEHRAPRVLKAQPVSKALTAHKASQVLAHRAPQALAHKVLQVLRVHLDRL